MLLTIILGLSVSSLLKLSVAATVVFTVIFSAVMLSAFIWFKLTLGIDEEEVRAIRSYIRRANEIKKKARRFLAPMKNAFSKMCPILMRI